MDNLISVIIPVYNAEAYLEKCLDSVIAQDYTPLEIVLINDGSKDGSGAICKRYRDRYSNIKYIEQANGGVSRARNRGIQEASGEYIAFIDSDDTIEAGYFRTLHDRLQKENADLSVVSIIDSKQQRSCMENALVDFREGQVGSFFDLNKAFLLYPPYAKLYKASIIKENKIMFPVELSYGEDLVFNCSYIRVCNRIVYDNGSTYCYCRDNQQSLSQKYRPDRFTNELILCDELKNLFVDKKVYDQNYEAYLQQRIFDEGYNAVFDALRVQLYSRQCSYAIKQILQNERFKESICWIPEGKYSKIIVNIMKIGSPRLLMAYYRWRA